MSKKIKKGGILKMRKFLTVLLVIAVMFTFSFGSAFAVTSDSIAAADAYVKQAVAVAEGNARLTKDYSKTAEDYAAEEAAKAAQLILSELVGKYDIDTTAGMNAFKAEVSAWALESGTPTYIGTGSLAFAKTTYLAFFDEKALAKDVDASIAEAVAEVKAIDTSVYSETVATMADGKDYTYRAYADKLKADAVSKLEKVAASGYKDSIKVILYGVGGTKDAPAVGGLYYELAQLLTVEAEKDLQTGATIDVDYAKAQVAYKAKVELYGQFKVAKGDSAIAKFDGKFKNEKLGDVVVLDKTNKIVMGVSVADLTKLTADEATKINAAMMDILNQTIEVVNVYFDELKITSVGTNGTVAQALNAVISGNSEDKIVAALAAIDKYEAAEKKAAEKKAAVMFDGSKQYDDAEIDEALAKDKADIYANFLNPQWVAKDYLGKVVTIVDPVANAIAEATAKFQDNIIYSGANKTAEADKIFCKDYYDVDYFGDDYDDIADEAKDALFEAKTIEEVNAIMANAEKELAELRTAKEFADMDYALNVKYQQAIEKYADQVMKDKILSTDDYKAESFADLVEDYVGTGGADYFNSAASAGKLEFARNMDEVKALYEEAKAAVDSLMPKKEMDAKAKEISDMFVALGSTPATVANEDKYMAANDAYEAYLDIYGARKTDVIGSLVFESKMNTLMTAQGDVVEEAIKAIPSTVTLADKAAVEAAREVYDKYSDYYGSSFDQKVTNLQKLFDAETAIYNAEVKNVKDMILKLTDASTAEEIEAAQAAYDALTGNQQRMVKAGLGSYIYKLEQMLQKRIDAVETLKITASSTAKKGSITVKWTVKGDATGVEGYEIWKSTKHSSGYKKAFTTTKKSYKNTKGLKKGTRYYYKVRAFAHVDGKKITSDWSNKARRIAK
ncbi:MAG: hypothetical protein ACI4LQ_07925 [Anaerovoracaceae bacterium]